jgi:hypothetical protein
LGRKSVAIFHTSIANKNLVMMAEVFSGDTYYIGNDPYWGDKSSMQPCLNKRNSYYLICLLITASLEDSLNIIDMVSDKRGSLLPENTE